MKNEAEAKDYVWGSAYVEGLFQGKHFVMEGLEEKHEWTS